MKIFLILWALLFSLNSYGLSPQNLSEGLWDKNEKTIKNAALQGCSPLLKSAGDPSDISRNIMDLRSIDFSDIKEKKKISQYDDISIGDLLGWLAAMSDENKTFLWDIRFGGCGGCNNLKFVKFIQSFGLQVIPTDFINAKYSLEYSERFKPSDVIKKLKFSQDLNNYSPTFLFSLFLLSDFSRQIKVNSMAPDIKFTNLMVTLKRMVGGKKQVYLSNSPIELFVNKFIQKKNNSSFEPVKFNERGINEGGWWRPHFPMVQIMDGEKIDKAALGYMCKKYITFYNKNKNLKEYKLDSAFLRFLSLGNKMKKSDLKIIGERAVLLQLLSHVIFTDTNESEIAENATKIKNCFFNIHRMDYRDGTKKTPNNSCLSSYLPDFWK